MNFDEYAADYDSALEKGIHVSGENKEFFSSTRIAWLSRCLKEYGDHPTHIMDFGCGTGSAAQGLLQLAPYGDIVGVDVSDESLSVARSKADPERAKFVLRDEHVPTEDIDLAFCSGVFHHIPVSQRPTAVRYVYDSLKPGGLFAVWENNPWNPGARYVMRRIPFDRNAVPITASATRRLLRNEGFDILRTDFLFIFPRMFRHLRFLEPALSCLPLGAQYQVLCRKTRSHARQVNPTIG
jgi:SAM-dependent methyltransferase